jgi:hypothetical protein
MAKTTRYAARKGRWNEAPYVVVNASTGEIVRRFTNMSEASTFATSLNPSADDPFEGLV